MVYSEPYMVCSEPYMVYSEPYMVYSESYRVYYKPYKVYFKPYFDEVFPRAQNSEFPTLDAYICFSVCKIKFLFIKNHQ